MSMYATALNGVIKRLIWLWHRTEIITACISLRFNPKTGKVSVLGELPTTLDDIYGICMYRDAQGEIYAIPNDKNGTFVQYHITAAQQKLRAEEVQRFSVQTQPEGCVVDDATGRILG